MEELLLNIEVNTGFIAETEDILELVDYLTEDGVTVYYDSDKELEDIIEDNDILQITKIVCEDCGEETYFIEEVFDEEGYTIPDDRLVFTYVDEDLLDCIEYTALDTEIVLVEIEYDDDEDCANCELYEEDFEETTASVLTDEFLDSLEEIDLDDGEAVYNLIVEYFNMAYESAKLDVLAELSDTMDAIKSLR